MKRKFTLTCFIISQLYYSQVIIGDAIGTAPTDGKTSVLLEFANSNNKGLLLPSLRNKPTNPSEGTLILDISESPTMARVKFYNGVSGDGWVDLSGVDGDATNISNNQPTLSNAIESSTAKTIIGDNTSTADGVLVLESTNKAMILPIVNDVNNIPSPSAGMIVYVNKSGAKRLAVFNGTTWSFWKP